MAVFAAVARLATIDCLMSALLTLALYLWWRFASQGKRRFLAASWAVLGLAFLAKGPVAAVLFVLVTAADAVAAGRWSKALRPASSAGLLVFAAIAIPWPIAIIAQVPGACEAWWAETVGRFIAGVDHSGSLWFPAAMTAAGAFPWYLMPLASMGRPGDWLRTWREDGRARFLAVWCIVVLVFFTACRSQLATYVLPGCAPIAVAAGGALAAAGAGRASRRGLLLTACAAGTMGAALLGYGAVRGHFAAAPAAALGTALAAATTAFLLLHARRRYRAAAAVLTATVAVSVVCMTPWVLGMVAARRSFADAARAWGPTLRDADMVLFAGEIRHSVPFYSRAVVRQVGSCEEAALALASPKRVAVLMREDVFEEAGPPLARFGREAGRHTVGRKPYLLLTNFDAEGAVAEGQTAP
jgi:4-amino-4-deoxy-L-arabinose transferase-like glycosyltransferase